MLSDMVADLLRWLRKGRNELGRPVVVAEPALGSMAAVPLPRARAAHPVVVEASAAPTTETIACGPRPTPFWTASGVHGILSARRPCILADVITCKADADTADAARPVTVAPEPPEGRAMPHAPAPALAQRLRQVREANRPVRHVPALKRQSRDILLKSAPAATAVKAMPAASETRPADDRHAPTVRTRPTLVYAA